MNIAKLQISPRNNGTPATQRDGCFTLQGERDWILTGDSVEIDMAEQALGSLCERVGQSLLVSFGNTVGRLTIPGLGLVEVVSGKWDEQHFEHMLSDLAEIATELPFAADQPTSFPYDRSVVGREDIQYHLFVYLRHILSPTAPRDQQLLPALQAVVQQPHQRFEQTRHDVPVAAAQRIDQPSLLRIAAGVGGLIDARTTAAANTPIARVLGGYLPRMVNERQIIHSYDTAENRFVKSFLQLALGVIEGTRRIVAASKTSAAFKNRIVHDCEQMEQALLPFVRHTLWQSVGTLQHVPTASTVLQGRRGYRDVYRHFVRLRLATKIPIDEQKLRDLLDAKDIAQLYEIWCYFTVARVIQELLGPPERAERLRPTALHLYVPHDLKISWANGVSLRYNPRYGPGVGAGHSYSVPLRPDIALHISGTINQAHLLDAKFKLDRFPAILPPDDQDRSDSDVGEIADERRGKFKRDDLYKMHTYRDALHGIESVWILYPGTESSFFSTSGKRLTLPGQQLPNDISGVGAIALRPETNGHSDLRQVLAQMLNRI